MPVSPEILLEILQNSREMDEEFFREYSAELLQGFTSEQLEVIKKRSGLGENLTSGDTLLHIAAIYNYITIVEKLKEKLPTIFNLCNDEGQTALNAYIQHTENLYQTNLNLLKTLENSSMFDNDGYAPIHRYILHIELEYEYPPIRIFASEINLLSSEECAIGKISPLFLAVSEKSHDLKDPWYAYLITQLLKAGANPLQVCMPRHAPRTTPLHYAAAKKDYDNLQEMLTKIIENPSSDDINVVDGNGRSILHLIFEQITETQFTNIELLNTLALILTCPSINLNLKNPDNISFSDWLNLSTTERRLTLLYAAVNSRRDGLVDLFDQHGADPTIVCTLDDGLTTTALHRALEIGEYTILRVMLQSSVKKGFNINVVDGHGDSILHKAVRLCEENPAKLIYKDMLYLIMRQPKIAFDLTDAKGVKAHDIAVDASLKVEIAKAEQLHQSNKSLEVRWVRSFAAIYGRRPGREPFQTVTDEKTNFMLMAAENIQRCSKGNTASAALTFVIRVSKFKYESEDSSEPTVAKDVITETIYLESLPGQKDFEENESEINKLKEGIIDRYNKALELGVKSRESRAIAKGDASKIDNPANDKQYKLHFHHTEQRIYEHLMNEEVLKRIVQQLMKKIAVFKETSDSDEVGFKISNVVLHMHSQRYMCQNCQIGGIGFLHPDSFLTFLKSTIESLKPAGDQIKVKEELKACIFISADHPSKDEDGYKFTEEDHKDCTIDLHAISGPKIFAKASTLFSMPAAFYSRNNGTSSSLLEAARKRNTELEAKVAELNHEVTQLKRHIAELTNSAAPGSMTTTIPTVSDHAPSGRQRTKRTRREFDRIAEGSLFAPSGELASNPEDESMLAGNIDSPSSETREPSAKRGRHG